MAASNGFTPTSSIPGEVPLRDPRLSLAMVTAAGGKEHGKHWFLRPTQRYDTSHRVLTTLSVTKTRSDAITEWEEANQC